MYIPEDSLDQASRQEDYAEDYFNKDISNRAQSAQLNLDANDEALIASRADMTRDYHSEFARARDPIKLKHELIEEGLNRGLFRRNQQSMAESQHRKDIESELESAEKMKNVLRAEKNSRDQEGQLEPEDFIFE